MTARPDKPLAEHTAEPWDVYPHPIDGAGAAVLELVEQVQNTNPIVGTLYLLNAGGKCPATTGCGPTSEANAARIVACVNALAGIPDPAALRASHDALVEALSYSEPYIETLHSLLLQNGGKESEAVKLCWKALKKARAALATAKELSA